MASPHSSYPAARPRGRGCGGGHQHLRPVQAIARPVLGKHHLRGPRPPEPRQRHPPGRRARAGLARREANHRNSQFLTDWNAVFRADLRSTSWARPPPPRHRVPGQPAPHRSFPIHGRRASRNASAGSRCPARTRLPTSTRSRTRARFATAFSTWSKHSVSRIAIDRSRRPGSPGRAADPRAVDRRRRHAGHLPDALLSAARQSGASARAPGSRVLFDVDDLIFDTRYVSLILETLDRNPGEAMLDEWFAADVARSGRCFASATAPSPPTSSSIAHRGLRATADMGRAQLPQPPAAGTICGGPAHAHERRHRRA